MSGTLIPAEDEGFRYGRGVFETLRVKEGRAAHLSWHRDSMTEGAVALGLNPEKMDPGPVPEGGGLWRWFLTPGQFITTWEPAERTVPSNIDLGLSSLRVSATSWEARYKTLSYLLMWQARHQAVTGWDVLLNEHGHLASATMANLFWVENGEIFTPDTACGCRAGTVRRWLLEASGRPVMTTHRDVSALDEASEIFITNSRLGILPVRSWRQRTLETSVGEVLASAYERAWG
jgi:branched-subunit amino acid aminotransferase/4-amino-4-deoxychorismate lyase